MANDQTKLRKPTWHKVSSIKPDIKRRNLIVKVVKVNNVEDQSFKEVIVGDESGVVTARFLEGQLSFAKQGNSLRLQNARVGMFKGHIRVECDKWSKLDTHEKQTWDPLTSNDEIPFFALRSAWIEKMETGLEEFERERAEDRNAVP